MRWLDVNTTSQLITAALWQASLTTDDMAQTLNPALLNPICQICHGGPQMQPKMAQSSITTSCLQKTEEGIGQNKSKHKCICGESWATPTLFYVEEI